MKTKKILSLVLAVLLLLGTMSVTAFADGNEATLDLETSATYEDNKEITQNYTFTQSGDITYTDVTKVKLDWTISDIAATYKSHKTWDPDTMAWVEEAKGDIAVTNEGATFNITNYSSEGIIANVEFKVEESLKDTFDKATFTNNNCAVKTPVTRDNNTYQDSDFTALKKTITASLTFNKDEFADLTATSSATKYGTYTVTIKGSQYLTFTAKTANSTVTPNFISGTWQYSTDNGANWTDGTNYVADENGNVTSGAKTTITLTNVDDKVLLKGTNCVTATDGSNCTHFVMTGSIAASGDVTSLTNGIGGNEALTDYCYGGMFSGCASLTTAPALPSTTLAEACYSTMFAMCTSLTTAPALPATTLAKACYAQMFFLCTSLVTAPALPATTLAEMCYQNMFSFCTSLDTAPALPATTLAAYCYQNMFYNCTSLVTAPALPATTLATHCYFDMFYNCISLVTAPALPATTLAEKCYNAMFYNCTSLVTATALPATTLAEMCYAAMFSDCTKLNVTTSQPTGTEGTDWGVIFSGAKTIGTSAVDNMFTDCIQGPGVNNTPTLGENITYYWYK